MRECHGFGFKGFNFEMQGRNQFQFEVGKTYQHRGKVELGKSGFHYCKELSDVFNFYPKGIYCRVVGYGDAEHNFVYQDDDVPNPKLCTKLAVETLHVIELLNGRFESKGNVYTFKDGLLQSYDDQPAVGNRYNCQYFYDKGKLHRDGNKPAIITPSGLGFYSHGVRTNHVWF
jgi:hypothetical protein